MILNNFRFLVNCIRYTGPMVTCVPVYLVTMVTMGPVCLMKLTRKRKLVRTLDFLLDFFPQLISSTGS